MKHISDLNAEELRELAKHLNLRTDFRINVLRKNISDKLVEIAIQEFKEKHKK